MKELNELVELVKAAVMDSARSSSLAFQGRCQPENILAIAKALRAVEQRAEAAEGKEKSAIQHANNGWDTAERLHAQLEDLHSKLAGLEKQEPIGYTTERAATYEVWNSGSACFWKDKDNGDFPLYARPAPAVSLAEPVPGEMETPTARINYSRGVADGWNDCRAAILRKIEEAK